MTLKKRGYWKLTEEEFYRVCREFALEEVMDLSSDRLQNEPVQSVEVFLVASTHQGKLSLASKRVCSYKSVKLQGSGQEAYRTS
jgi:hypothetical protein